MLWEPRAVNKFNISTVTQYASAMLSHLWIAILSGVHGEAPVPFSEQSFVDDIQGRLIKLESAPTFGHVKDQFKGIRPISLLSSTYSVSECHWGTYKSVLFLGLTPKACRRGTRLDGEVDRGWALLTVTRNDKVTVRVHYPRPLSATQGNIQTEQVGPFSMCAPGDRGIYACKAEEFTAVEIYQNASSVWVQDPLIAGQSTFFQLMGLIQSVVFAMLAGAPVILVNEGHVPLLLRAAADSAVGGVVTMAFLFARGRSIVGLDLEIGHALGAMAEMAVVAWTASLAANAWMHGWAASSSYVYPLHSVAREFCEVPILVSLVIVWPMVSGPNFIIQLQFLVGLAVSYISGRASGILVFGIERAFGYAALSSAFVLFGGVSTGTLFCLPAVSQTGALNRGGTAVAFTLTLQAHAAGAAFIFAAPSRLKKVATKTRLNNAPLDAPDKLI